jgi:hypothetical protein
MTGKSSVIKVAATVLSLERSKFTHTYHIVILISPSQEDM